MQKLLTIQQVADLFPGKGKRWVDRTLIRHGLPVLKVGNYRFITEEGLTAFIQKLRAEAETGH